MATRVTKVKLSKTVKTVPKGKDNERKPKTKKIIKVQKDADVNPDDKESFLNLFTGKDVIPYHQIDQVFLEKVARSLLSKYVLVVGEKEYRIAEVEFYVKNDTHSDTYTHGDKNQKTFGKWYFHRYPNGSYKSGTYKGVDLTLGNKDTYFGVLIRSIYDIETDEMIDGPCKTVNKILELNNCQDVAQYMADRSDPLSVRSTKNFYLKRKAHLPEEQIYKGPRIGLSDKYPEWKNVQYRFLIKKKYIKKGKADLVEL